MNTEQNQIATLDAEFTTVLVPASIKAGMKSLEAGSRDLWQIDPAKLCVIEGFNPRVMNDEYRAHIRDIANSIKTEGYFQDQPMAGYVATVDGAPVVYVYSGHTRLAAALLAISEGADLERVPVVVSQAGLSMEDMTVALIRGNGGRNLTYYESAVVCKRLVKFGISEEVIAERTGISVPLVRNRLALMAAPLKLREMVANDSMSATLALDLLKNHGAQALEKAEEAKAVAEDSGKAKIHKVPQSAQSKFIKKSSPVLYSIAKSVHSDPGFNHLSAESKALLEKFMADVEGKGERSDTEAA